MKRVPYVYVDWLKLNEFVENVETTVSKKMEGETMHKEKKGNKIRVLNFDTLFIRDMRF